MSGPFDTIFPADTLEFCPNEGSTDVFLCGTYKLVEQPDSNPPLQAKRIGQCLVFHLDPKQASDCVEMCDASTFWSQEGV